MECLLSLSPIHIFHFGSYEERVFRRVAEIFCDQPEMDNLLSGDKRSNALAKIFGKVYFPTYSNGLKDVGRFLGCSWSEDKATGLCSLMWRKQWEQTADVCSQDIIKNKIFQYNKEDCVALKAAVEFLYQIDDEESTGLKRDNVTGPVYVAEISDGEYGEKFGKKDFAFPEFEEIGKCAYFDYQQSRVYFRDHAKKRGRQRKFKSRARKPSYRINRTRQCRAVKCPFCGNGDIERGRGEYFSKLTLDLRATSTSIRRWVTKIGYWRHTCRTCGKNIVPSTFSQQPRYGHSLLAWVVHNHVSNRATFEQMQATLRDHFDLDVCFRRLHALKATAARYYARTYRDIAKRLVAGRVLHADETKVRLQKEDAYVWVFANSEDVFYLYRPDRKADFLTEFLADFNGVLVTDFYSGYDSLGCAKQKCLVHFLRDLNDALVKCPFDIEAQEFGRSFGKLMRQIVESIDRFGLRKRYLAKYLKDADKWLSEIETKRFDSGSVETLRKRAVKYGPSLFEFLKHDSVPWNNNNAEHAVKPFAKYRRLVNGRVTDRGITDYLVLLSVAETCQYRGISFWEFLLSGSKDLM
jgi:hypothetical protein